MKKKIINITKSIIVLILFFFSSYFRYIPIYLFKLNFNKLSNFQKIELSLFSNICLIIILFIIYRKELVNEWKIFKKNIREDIDIGFKYWFIGFLVMAISNVIITFVFKNAQANNEQQVQKLIDYAPFIMLISAGIAAPIYEEITFRKAFKNIIKNKYLFILISGIVFGSLHVITQVNTITDLLYIIPYSSLGIALAGMYQKTDTIYTSITMHMLHNSILLIISIL